MKRYRLKIVAVVLIVAVVCAGVWLKANVGTHSRTRKAWKNAAVARMAEAVADSGWPASEIAKLTPPSDKEAIPGDTWIAPRLILMKNGEWIAYASISWHENWRVRDLFIGRGSDAKWYYSNYHFCADMLVARTHEIQPPTLADFITWHYLRKFDGRSDDCLESTWPADSDSYQKARSGL